MLKLPATPFKRRIVIAVGIVCVVVLSAYLGMRAYLRSARVAEQVTTRLEELYGGPVSVGDVDIGLTSTTIRDFQLHEPGGASTDASPWLKVAALTADVSLRQLVTGEAAPGQVRLDGANLLLRFDRAGDLLTRFPSRSSSQTATLPETIVERGEITFRKDGHGDLVIKNVMARLKDRAGRWKLTGSGESPDLGKLTFDGAMDKDAKALAVRLKTEPDRHVTQALLDRLPFVPVEVWREIQIAEGTTGAELSIDHDRTKDAVHYRIELAPRETKLHIPSVALRAQHASGKVVIEDNLVQLRGVKGQAFGGSIALDADLDFRSAPSRLTFFEIKVENLDVRDLPEEWNVPIAVRKSIANGKLFGRATLEVAIGTPTSAASAATLMAMAATPGAWLPSAGVSAAWPAHETRIHSQGKGEVRDPRGIQAPIEFDWQLAQPQPRGSLLPRQDALAEPPDPEIRLRQAELLARLLAHHATLLVQGAKEKTTPPGEYLDLNFNLKNASLAEFIKNEDLKLPFPVEGTLSFQVKASIPTGRLDDFKAYKAHGSAQITKLEIAGVKLDEVTADFDYHDGTLYMKSLKGALPADKAPGALEGSGQAQLAPLGELKIDLSLAQVALQRLADLPQDEVRGTLSGHVAIRGNLSKLQNANELLVDGKIASDQLAVHGLNLAKLSSSVQLRDGVFTFPDITARLEDTPIAAAASLRLQDDHSFAAKLEVRDWNLAAFRKLAAKNEASIPDVAGAFSANVVLTGKLKPFQVAATGDARAANVKLDAFETHDVHFQWEADAKTLRIKDLKAALYEGTAIGAANVPFDAKTPGKIDLQVRGLDARPLAKDLRVPFAIDGHVNGTLKGTLPAVANGQERTATFHLDLTAPKLRVQNIPTEQLHGTLAYQQGAIDYKLAGRTLGGTFDLEGQIPGERKPKDGKKEAGDQGRLRIDKVEMARLFTALGLDTDRDLKGVLQLDVRFTHDQAGRFPRGQGTLRIANLQWRDTVLADNLQGDVLLSEDKIRVRDLGGDLGQGTFTGQFAYYLRQPERGWFTLNLDRVEAGQILAPWLDKKIEGPIQARIRGNLGAHWRGQADFEMAHGNVLGLDVSQWRLPVTWTFSPREAHGQIDIPETSAQVSRGRAAGKLALAWDHAARLEGHLRLDGVELQDLLRQTIGPSDVAGGKTTARFQFKGSDVRSLKDIGGTLVASFKQAQALQVPVLKQIAPYLGVGASTTFQTGELRARLDRGFLDIEQLTLQGNNVHLFVDGKISLEDRLDLHVVARTGDIWPTARLGPLAVRIPAVGPVPLVVAQEVSALLANHVLYLDVTGTTRSPVIRPRPLAILSQAAVRFFANRANLPISLNP